MTPPRAAFEIRNADLARMTGLSRSMIGYYVNDCYDANEDRMKFPSEEAIEKLSAALHLNADAGKAARFWKPDKSVSFLGLEATVPTGTHPNLAAAWAESLRAIAGQIDSSAPTIEVQITNSLSAYGEEIDARPYMYALSSVQNASGGLGIERIVDGDTPGEDYTRDKFKVRAIRVRGDSMAPVLRDGEVALVLPPEAVYDGCFVTATVDIINAVCKRIRIPENGESFLEPINGEGVITEDRFVVTGVVADKVTPLLPPRTGR